MRFEDCAGFVCGLFNRLGGDAGERDFEAPVPNGVGLAGESADTDIDKTRIGRTLDEGAEEIGSVAIAAGSGQCREFEDQIVDTRSLLLDDLVVAALSFLEGEVDACRRLLENDAKFQFTVHVTPSLQALCLIAGWQENHQGSPKVDEFGLERPDD